MGYYEVLDDGRRVYVEGDSKELALVETLDSATTLTDQDSGKIFILNAAAGAQVDLPAVAKKGFKATFIVGAAFATTNWDIVSPAADISGVAIVNGASVNASGATTIRFSESAETIGDRVSVVSDGTSYFITDAVGSAAASIAFS